MMSWACYLLLPCSKQLSVEKNTTTFFLQRMAENSSDGWKFFTENQLRSGKIAVVVLL